MEEKKTQFPNDFLWGAATSSYQIEGGNSNSDWWEWERKGRTGNESGMACDYWNRWKEDHGLAEELGVNAFRLSLEWARIEPEEEKFSQEAIAHYREILQDLKNRNIKTVVTLWHWTSPIWFQEKYGFHKKESIGIFTRYAKKVTEELGNNIDIFVVLNEPMVPLGQGFLTGLFPPGHKNLFKFLKAADNLAKAHNETYEMIHSFRSDAMVGISYLYNRFNLVWPLNRMVKWFRIDYFGNKIKGHQDYFGVDYYREVSMKDLYHFGYHTKDDKNSVMGWTSSSKGFAEVLKEANKYKLPIFIIENGLPTVAGTDDVLRVGFIQEHLSEIKKAIGSGIDIRGYFHWSFMDNYEWLYGFEPRFGLIEVDYETLDRKPRKSYYRYRDIIKENQK
jgi:beta-glucosidase